MSQGTRARAAATVVGLGGEVSRGGGGRGRGGRGGGGRVQIKREPQEKESAESRRRG